MREYFVKVTSKGRVTLPAGVRRSLGIQPGDQVTFIVVDGHAGLKRVEHTVASVFGSFPTPPGLVTEDFDELIEEAMEDHADWVVQRMRARLE